MKKTTRILTVLALAASSVLFATPSHAAALGAADVSVSGTLTTTTLSANSLYYSASSSGTRDTDQVTVTIGGKSFYLASLNENTLMSSRSANAIGVPATPVSGYDLTINWITGYGYMSKGDIYTGGSRVYEALCPSGNFTAPTTCSGQKTNRFFAPLVQFNYVASTGVVHVRVPVTSGSGALGFPATVYVNTSGNFEYGSETVTSWVDVTSFVIGVGTSTGSATRVRGNIKATVDSVTFADDGTGTGGSLSWKGTNIDSVLYTGPAATYPKAYNYGAYTSSWNGALLNLTPDTTYTLDFYVNSIDDYPAMKSVTFKTGPAPATAVVKDIAYWTKFVDTYVIYAQEASNMKKLMSKFNALETSPYRSYIKVPNSRVSKWSAESLTPNSCRVENQGVVRALSADTCTISYTVSGLSKAPVTLVKDFKFTKFSA
jgi:hypothetical protein